MVYIFKFIKKFWFIFVVIIFYFVLGGLHILPPQFNLFGTKKLKINDTPVIVQKIKEIGELTTAEFFGEVYADLNEVYDELIKTKKREIIANAGQFYNDYSGLEIYMKIFIAKDLKEKEYKQEHKRYETMLKNYMENMKEFSKSRKMLLQQLAKAGNANKKRAIQVKIDNLRNDLEDRKKELSVASSRFELIELQYKEKNREYWEGRKQRNLVYIGRGWVKAGVDLRNISPQNIIINSVEESSIKVILPEPVILNADINPWFIYTKDKKIKGFEIFLEKTGSIFSYKNFTDKEVGLLKSKCKDKLKEAAIKKELLKNAKTSATQTLENFFHLLGFKKVVVEFRH